MTRSLGLISLIMAMPPVAYAQVFPGEASPTPQHVALNHGVSLDEVSQSPQEDSEQASATEPKVDQTIPTTVVRRSRPTRSAGEARQRTEAATTPWYRSGLGALAVVLAIVGLAAWAVRRWIPSARINDSGGLRVVGRTSVTPKHSVALIRVGRRFVLVGVSGERMTALCDVNDPDEVAELTRQAGITGADAFNEVLLNEATNYREPAEDEPVAARSPSTGSTRPLNDLLQRLKSLQRQ